MLRRSLVACLLFTVLASPASFAQTADGVGGGNDDVNAASAEDDARDVLSLAGHQRKFYQLALRTWAIGVPSFVLNGFFDAHMRNWHDGVHNFAYGAEFTTRIPDKYDVVVSVDWANLRTADGFWLESDDPIIDANWAENDISLLTFDVSFHWLTNLDRQDTWQLYYGIGLGAMIRLGQFRKYEILASDCGQDFVANRDTGETQWLEQCMDENGEPSVDWDRPKQEDRIPPVLPALSLTTGLRYLIGDQVSIALETGMRAPYFYGGIEVGYFWESEPRNR